MRIRSGETIEIARIEHLNLPHVVWSVDNGLGLSSEGRAETTWGALWAARRALRRIQGIRR